MIYFAGSVSGRHYSFGRTVMHLMGFFTLPAFRWVFATACSVRTLAVAADFLGGSSYASDHVQSESGV